MATPFDLHVLGTPPAFILSQDRTLTFKFFHRSRDGIYLGIVKDLFCLYDFARQFAGLENASRFLGRGLSPYAVVENRSLVCKHPSSVFLRLRMAHCLREDSGLYHCSVFKVLALIICGQRTLL